MQDTGGYSEFGVKASDAAIRRWRGDRRHLRQGAELRWMHTRALEAGRVRL